MARAEAVETDAATARSLRPEAETSILARTAAVASAPENAQPLGVFVLTRFVFLLLTYFGVILFSDVLHPLHGHPSFLHALLPAWNQWDTRWYIDIARRGYGWKKAVGTGPAAFFPLYPILIHAVGAILHRSLLLCALLISNACFLAALLVLWRLVAWELDESTAARTTLYIAVFPTALFFFAGYTESLLLLLAVTSFYFMRSRNWIWAGVFAGLASATRPTGVLLVLPLLYEYARDRNFRPRDMLGSGLLGLALAPSGLLAFMLYLQYTLGDALAFSHYQAAWQKIFTLRIWAGFLESFRQILLVQPPASFYQAHNVLNVSLGGIFLVCTFLAARRLPASYILYLVGFWLVTLPNPAMEGGYPVPLVSLSRYILALFPIFMYFGIIGRRRWLHDAYLVTSTAWLALLTVQYVKGGWVI